MIEAADADPSELTDGVAAVAAELAEIRREWRDARGHDAEYGSEGFPSRGDLAKIVGALCGALYPLRLGPDFVRPHNEHIFVEQTLQTTLARLYGQVRLELIYAMSDDAVHAVDARAREIVQRFTERLPTLRRLLDTDVEAAWRGDPAARSVDEVLICYPSMLAIIHHRLAHQLHVDGAKLVARIIAEVAHDKTGIDIHPGAQIGDGFFIDHGTGVVIGETAILGRNVRLYQGVTLGARSFAADDAGVMVRNIPRHPIVEDDVVIYAGATILGRVTIGARSEIGGNVWLTHDVPPGSRVIQAREQNSINGAQAARAGSAPGKDGDAGR